jgi:transposase-like protein
MIERLNQSVKQRTKVAKIFANEDSCLRLVSAVNYERVQSTNNKAHSDGVEGTLSWKF